MDKSRLDSLKEMLEMHADDSFTRYALGLELAASGLPEDASAEFERVIAADPNYHPVYYQLGKVYETLGDVDKARKIYERGIYVAASQSEFHAKEELESALNELF